MGINSFWLFYIEADSVLVALINWGNGRFYVASIGPRVACDITNHQSILKAADESLSSAATSADISPEQEPLFVGLVLPSSWVGEDGKIIKSKSDIILSLLKELDLKPSGFMSNDEAIIEDSSKPDDFPASFITIYLEGSSFDLSLVYLGKIKKRLKKFFDGEFNPQLVEDALLELNSESTLPPQIYLYGQADDSILDSLKNFPWVGKKNVETFLHFPDIKLYQDHELINIFFRAITSQMLGSGNSSHQPIPPAKIESQAVEELEEIAEASEDLDSESSSSEPVTDTEKEVETELDETETLLPLTEVSFQDLGFTKNQPEPELLEVSSSNIFAHQNSEAILPPVETPVSTTPKNPISLKLPKIKFNLPKLKFNFLLLIFPLALIILAAPLFLAKTDVTIFVTPYEFDKTINVTLDSQAAELSSSIIPVDQKTVTINSSVTLKTTGQKIVGNKATGEITVFNKLEKVQNLPKGTIIIDSKGQKFEIINNIQVASSTSNFDTGIMNFGQAKTVISASDIGPEYNISKDSSLTFKDFSESSLVIKINSDFSGGTKEQISAVSQQDKTNVESQLAQQLKNEADDKINQEVNTSNDAIKETIQIKKGKTELNREVGEESNELTATAQSTVSVLVFKSELKDKILNLFLAQESGFSDSDLIPGSFTFSLKINKIDTDKATGSLNIKGSSLPKINTAVLQKNLSGKTDKKAQEIIKKTITRAYNFHISTNFKILNILPLNPQNILIDTKTESL